MTETRAEVLIDVGKHQRLKIHQSKPSYYIHSGLITFRLISQKFVISHFSEVFDLSAKDSR